MLETIAQTHGFQSLLSSRQRFTLRQTADEKRHSRIFQSGKLRQQVVKLINKAQLLVAQFSFRCRRQFAHWLTIKNHIAGGWRIQPAQQVQQGTFTGTRATDDRHHFTFADAETDIVQHIGLHTAFLIAFAQVVALQQDLIHNVKPQRVEWRQRAMKGKA